MLSSRDNARVGDPEASNWQPPPEPTAIELRIVLNAFFAKDKTWIRLLDKTDIGSQRPPWHAMLTNGVSKTKRLLFEARLANVIIGEEYVTSLWQSHGLYPLSVGYFHVSEELIDGRVLTASFGSLNLAPERYDAEFRRAFALFVKIASAKWRKMGGYAITLGPQYREVLHILTFRGISNTADEDARYLLFSRGQTIPYMKDVE